MQQRSAVHCARRGQGTWGRWVRTVRSGVALTLLYLYYDCMIQSSPAGLFSNGIRQSRPLATYAQAQHHTISNASCIHRTRLAACHQPTTRSQFNPKLFSPPYAQSYHYIWEENMHQDERFADDGDKAQQRSFSLKNGDPDTRNEGTGHRSFSTHNKGPGYACSEGRDTTACRR